MFDLEQTGGLGDGFFLGGKAPAGPEGGNGPGADGGLVVVGGEEDGAGGVGEGNGSVDFAKEGQFAGGCRRGVPEAEAFFLQEVEPGAEGTGWDVAGDAAIAGGLALRDAVGAKVFEGARGDFGAAAHGGKVAEKGLEADGGRVVVFEDFGAVGDAELVEGQSGQAEDGGAVEALDGDGGGGAALEFVEGGVLLFFELVGELAAVAFVEDDDGFFGGTAVDFAEAAARGLQDHVAGAVALLREDDAGEGAAVPAFLADLDEEDDADGAVGGVEGGEGEFGALGGGVFLVAAMVAEDGGGGVDSVFFAKPDGEGKHLGFETGDGAAVDGEFCAGAGSVALVAEAGEEFRDAAAHDVEGVGGVADDLDNGFLEKGANAFDEWEVVDGVGDFGGLDFQVPGDADFFRRGEVGRAGEAEHGADGAGSGPFRDDGAELDFGIGGVVGLVDENGKDRDFGNGGAELVGGGGFLVLGTLVQKHGLVVFEVVEDDFFGVGDGDKAGEVPEGLQGGELLDVGVADAVGTGRGGVGVEHHEAEHAAQPGGQRFGHDPGRVEGLDGAQAGDDGGFEAGRRHHKKVFRKGGVVRFLQGKGEVKVEECRHQEGFACAHGEGEEIVGVGHAVEEVAKNGGGLNRSGVVFEAGEEGGGQDAAAVRHGLGGELQERQGVGVGCEMVAHGLRHAQRIGVDGVQEARGKDFVEGAVAAGDLEEEIGFDGVDLDRTQTSRAAHVVELCAERTIAAVRPLGRFALQELVDHVKPLFTICPKFRDTAMFLHVYGWCRKNRRFGRNPPPAGLGNGHLISFPHSSSLPRFHVRGAVFMVFTVGFPPAPPSAPFVLFAPGGVVRPAP